MTQIAILQMPLFKKFYKKLSSQDKESVNDAIKNIVTNPKIGEEKKGDLSKVFVYKFKVHHKQMLLAYEWNSKTRILLALGSHENFYRDLKKNRK